MKSQSDRKKNKKKSSKSNAAGTFEVLIGVENNFFSGGYHEFTEKEGRKT
jgi:hypothetical protein